MYTELQGWSTHVTVRGQSNKLVVIVPVEIKARFSHAQSRSVYEFGSSLWPSGYWNDVAASVRHWTIRRGAQKTCTVTLHRTLIRSSFALFSHVLGSNYCGLWPWPRCEWSSYSSSHIVRGQERFWPHLNIIIISNYFGSFTLITPRAVAQNPPALCYVTYMEEHSEVCSMQTLNLQGVLTKCSWICFVSLARLHGRVSVTCTQMI